MLRFLLRLINLLLALVGLAMVAYTGYMFDKFKHTEFPPSTEYLAVAAPSAQPRKAGFPWYDQSRLLASSKNAPYNGCMEQRRSCSAN